MHYVNAKPTDMRLKVFLATCKAGDDFRVIREGHTALIVSIRKDGRLYYRKGPPLGHGCPKMQMLGLATRRMLLEEF